jgi:hypothetical protein
MTVEQLYAIQDGFLAVGAVGVGMVVVGVAGLVLPRLVAALRVVSEARRDTTPGVWRVNPDTWDLAESVDPVRDLGRPGDE